MIIAKKGKIRKEELLNTAADLFKKKGYEKTSINDIIERVGVTKGAFYHYFKGKEEILDTLIMEESRIGLAIIDKISKKETLNAIEKTNAIVDEFNKEQVWERHLKMIALIENDLNLLLRHKFVENFLSTAMESHLRIMQQGIKEKLFNTPFPQEATEFIIHFWALYRTKILKIWHEEKSKNIAEKKVAKYAIFCDDIVERLLGAPSGSIKLFQGFCQSIGHYYKKKK